MQQSSLVMDPPVTVQLGLMKLSVASTPIVPRGTPSSYAATCATLVWIPCPLSQPWGDTGHETAMSTATTTPRWWQRR